MQLNLIQKILMGTILFICGIGFALCSEQLFRETIQNIFRWSTSGKIEFVGKNVTFFSNNYYCLTFGIIPVVVTFESLYLKKNQILKYGFFWFLIFCTSIFIISSIDANLKVVECTACEHGIRKLDWNAINYDLIIGSSAIISIVPALFRIIKRYYLNTKKKSC